MTNRINIPDISDEDLKKSLFKVSKYFQSLRNYPATTSEEKHTSKKLDNDIAYNYTRKLLERANKATNSYIDRIEKIKSRPDTSRRK